MSYKLREYRNKAGITAQQAATEIGVSITTMFKWERGETDPDAKNVLSLCAIYGTDPNHLLGFAEQQ